MKIKLFSKKEKQIANVPKAIKRAYGQRLQRQSEKTPEGNVLFNNTFWKQPKSKDITLDDLDYIYNRCPLIAGGINKISMDLFRAWHKFGNDCPQSVQNKIKAFYNKVWDDYGDLKTLKSTIIGAAKTAFRKGDAFLEMVDGQPPEKPLNVSNFSHVVEIDPDSMGFVLTDDKKDIAFWLQKRGFDDYIKFHPSRIIHVKIYSIEDDVFGLAVSEIAYNVAKSLMNADYAEGEILYRFGHGFPVVNIDGADDELIKDMYEQLGKITPKTGFVGDENYHFDIKNPNAIDPEPFNQHFYRSIAAALGIPMAILVGMQKGAVKGSEVDIGQYYQYLHSIQENVFTPILKRIYAAVLGQETFDYEIIWNEIYVDEKAEAEVIFTKAKAARYLIESGVMDVDEVRQALFGLPTISEMEKQEGIDEMDDSVYGGTLQNGWRIATNEEIAQEQRIRQALQKIVERERKLGEEILKEQGDL